MLKIYIFQFIDYQQMLEKVFLFSNTVLRFYFSYSFESGKSLVYFFCTSMQSTVWELYISFPLFSYAFQSIMFYFVIVFFSIFWNQFVCISQAWKDAYSVFCTSK